MKKNFSFLTYGVRVSVFLFIFMFFAVNVFAQVASTLPEDNAVDVDVNTSITVTFSKDMNPTTINTTTFSLKTGTAYNYTTIASTVSYSNKTATLKPSTPLNYAQSYACVLTKDVKGADGVALTAD